MIIDLRSDTVTRPTAAMHEAIAKSEVGDDVYGDDPTVNRLEDLAAKMMGKESSLFVSSGTQSNLLALLSHCERGDEYIVGQQAHTYKYEGGGAAVLGSIQPQPLDFEADGRLDLNKVAEAVKVDDIHFAKTRLLCLENTQGGKVLPLDYLKEASDFAKERGLAIHLDGARAFNAAVKLNVPITEISQHFDSVSICLSKGLGAPVGSVLNGSEELIRKARRWRKMLGGGMRQAGILAAAGIVALEQQVKPLAEDHKNAELLGSLLLEMNEFSVDPVQTNMVFATPVKGDSAALAEYLKENNILITGSKTVRFVTHHDVSQEAIYTVVEKIRHYYSSSS
ncbi:MAG: low-specificity L-threonine aldolase [SAR324 cluster bacterium]|nr:low-specificity L-threonine aldolase [SAR324 cluster bacterium]